MMLRTALSLSRIHKARRAETTSRAEESSVFSLMSSDASNKVPVHGACADVHGDA